MPGRVLVVEDDASVAHAVAMVLRRAGFEVEQASDGLVAVDLACRADGCDVVVLDVMLPGRDGFEVCRLVRERSSLPIVFLTARQDAADAVTGLELGGDDYVTKPFDPHELVARVRAVLRRTGTPSRTRPIEVRDLRIDPAAVRVQRGGADVVVSATEFKLLAFLAERAGDAITRDELVEHVWGHSYLGDSRLVDMAVLRLRERLGTSPAPPPYVTTVRGVGYRFERG